MAVKKPEGQLSDCPHTGWLRSLALAFPEVEESGVCTRISFKAQGKNFAFVGLKDEVYDAMFKLKESLDEARELAEKEPDHYRVGTTGWVTVVFPRAKAPPKKLLEKWLAESHRCLVPPERPPAARRRTSR